MTAFNITPYLNRISYHDAPTVNLQTLRALHRHHVLAIPFEALNIYFNKPINIDLNSIYTKVVENNRGGYCYELNQLFNGLLKTIGFDTTIISAEVMDDNGNFGQPFDHLSTVVDLDGQRYLADVGFGDLFREPILIEPDLVQVQTFKKYKIETFAPDQFLVTESLLDAEDYRIKYRFSLKEREPSDFEDQNQFKQQNPNSHFVKNRICTIATPNGRKTIRNEIYKHRENDEVTSVTINDDTQLLQIIKDEFGMEI